MEEECDKCHGKSQTLQTVILNMPDILVLHMKELRISSDGNMIKLDANLRCPEFLGICSYCVNCKGSVYELYAFVQHSGTWQCGHYTCTTKRRHPIEDRQVWVEFDDDYSIVRNNMSFNIDNACLLFFRKVDMPVSSYLDFTNLQYLL